MKGVNKPNLLSPSLESSERSELASEAPVRALAFEDSAVFSDGPVEGGGDGSSDVKEPPDDGERAVDGMYTGVEGWARGGENNRGGRHSNSVHVRSTEIHTPPLGGQHPLLSAPQVLPYMALSHAPDAPEIRMRFPKKKKR